MKRSVSLKFVENRLEASKKLSSEGTISIIEEMPQFQAVRLDTQELSRELRAVGLDARWGGKLKQDVQHDILVSSLCG